MNLNGAQVSNDILMYSWAYIGVRPTDKFSFSYIKRKKKFINKRALTSEPIVWIQPSEKQYFIR